MILVFGAQIFFVRQNGEVGERDSAQVSQRRYDRDWGSDPWRDEGQPRPLVRRRVEN